MYVYIMLYVQSPRRWWILRSAGCGAGVRQLAARYAAAGEPGGDAGSGQRVVERVQQQIQVNVKEARRMREEGRTFVVVVVDVVLAIQLVE